MFPSAMGHIDGHGGRFLTVRASNKPSKHAGDPAELYSVVEAPTPSAEGYRIVWVYSTAKAARDGHYRQGRVEAVIPAIEALEAKLAGPRSRIKTRIAAEKAVTTALAPAHATRWVTF